MNQVHLILGDDEFLTERARLSIQKAAGEGVEVVRLKASEVSEGEIAMATSPSLFGDNRVIVISDVERWARNSPKSSLRPSPIQAPA